MQPMSSFTKGLETPEQKWARWPNSSTDPAKNNPEDTKWDWALTAHSSLETISPIMHMTRVSGLVSYKGCIMNSQAWWTPHNETAPESCQASCFYELISEAITVNTSQWRHLETQWRSGLERTRSHNIPAHLWGKVSYDQKIKMTEPQSLETKKYGWYNSKRDHVTNKQQHGDDTKQADKRKFK